MARRTVRCGVLTEPPPLSRHTVDRDALARRRPGLLRQLAELPTTRILLVRGGLLPVTADGALALVGIAQLPLRLRSRVAGLTAGEGTDVPGEPLLVAYLGRDDHAAYLAVALPEDAALPEVMAPAGTWAGLREVGADLGDRDAGLATTALALAAWHERHTRCPRCGEPTEPYDAGWTRRCRADASEHYPRTDPAVIVAVTDEGGRLLLAHAAPWARERFSVVAGFVEPGESLEAAVQREVAEETGLTVDSVAYVGSQPWPFPSSLMLGFRARVSGGRLQADGEEVTEAVFVTRDELTARLRDGRIRLPARSSIARVLIEDWFGAALPDT